MQKRTLRCLAPSSWSLKGGLSKKGTGANQLPDANGLSSSSADVVKKAPKRIDTPSTTASPLSSPGSSTTNPVAQSKPKYTHALRPYPHAPESVLGNAKQKEEYVYRTGAMLDPNGDIRPAPLIPWRDLSAAALQRWKDSLFDITHHLPHYPVSAEAQIDLNEFARRLPERLKSPNDEVRLERILRATYYRMDRELGIRPGILTEALEKFLPEEGKALLKGRSVSEFVKSSECFSERGPTVRLKHGEELKYFIFERSHAARQKILASTSYFSKGHVICRQAASVALDYGVNPPNPTDLGFKYHMDAGGYDRRQKLTKHVAREYFLKRADCIGRAMPTVNVLLYGLFQEHFITTNLPKELRSCPFDQMPFVDNAISALLERGIEDRGELVRQAKIVVGALEHEVKTQPIVSELIDTKEYWNTLIRVTIRDGTESRPLPHNCFRVW